MNAAHKDQRLEYTGSFDCAACNASGYVPDEHGSVACPKCDTEGVVELNCELRFDIIPGTPPILHGRPEDADTGDADEVTRFAVFIGDEDKTSEFRSLDEAHEFIYNKWTATEPDHSNEPHYED